MSTIDERARHDLFQAVHDVLGPRHAHTLMSLLPPVGWAEVATKHDLRGLETRLDLRFEALEHKLTAQIERSHKELTRTLVLGLVGSMATMTSLLLTTMAFVT